MKILTFQHPGDVIPSITRGRIEALEAMGHSTLCLDRDKIPLASRDDFLRLMQIIRDFAPDFALFYGYIGLITVIDEQGRTVPLFEKLKIPYASMITNLGSLQTRSLLSLKPYIGMQYYHLFVCDTFYEEFLRRMGFKHVHHLDLATAPGQFFRIDPAQADEATRAKLAGYRADVAFCGNAGNPRFDPQRYTAQELDFLVSEVLNYKYRRDILNAVRRHTVECYGRLAVPGDYGPNLRWHGWTPAEELNAIYNAARVVINIVHPLIAGSIPTRVFDAMAAGALVVSDYRWRLGETFRDGEEIVYFRHPGEIDGLLDRYLGDEALRARVAENGRRAVLAAHTWRHRMEEIIRVLGQTRYD